MALKHRISDANYWVYDRARHKSAFDAAPQPGTAADLGGLREHKYALLVTFRKDGAEHAELDRRATELRRDRGADARVVRPARRAPPRHAYGRAHRARLGLTETSIPG